MTAEDSGLAAERTTLSWSRTALSLLGVAALTLRFARRETSVLGEAIAIGALLTAAGAWQQGRRQARLGRALPATGALRALALAVVVTAVGAAVTVLLALS